MPRCWFVKGYPSMSMVNIKIITDARTDAAYATGKEEAIKLRP